MKKKRPETNGIGVDVAYFTMHPETHALLPVLHIRTHILL